MRKIIASSFFHRFAGGFAFGAVAVLAMQPHEATAALLGMIA